MKIALALADPNVSEFFTILRSDGQWIQGRFQDTKTEIRARGTVSMASPKEAQMLPEADFVTGARAFYTNQPLYPTRSGSEAGVGTSDVILYDGEKWKVASAFPYRNRGYWKAICVRMLGE